MKLGRIRWLAIIAALLVLGAGYLALIRRVTVLADGSSYQVVTRALTVRGALHTLGLRLGPDDAVEPSAYSLLHEGLIIAVHRAAWVQLNAYGKTYSLVTAERSPAELLKHWGVALSAGDSLYLAGEPIAADQDLPPSAGALVLEIRKPVAITLTDGNKTTQFTSTAATLWQALTEQGIAWQAADRLEPAAETALTQPVSATLTRAREIQITMGGQKISLLSAADTVGGALAEAGISLQGLDRSQPDEDQAIPSDGEIRVRRITESVELQQTTLAHETEWQPDANANLDTTSVVQAGQDGVQAARTRVRYDDGAEVSRKQEPQRVVVAPQKQINGYGTKIVIYTEVVGGVSIQYYRKIQVFTTWYSACNSGVSGCLYGTSAGIPLAHGVIATWLNWYRELKLATVYIPNYGPGVIADVGAWPDRSVPWMDLAFDEPVAGIPWSNEYVTVYFTTPVPDNVPLIWPP